MPAEIVIDALFGAGLDRPVEGLARAMIEAMNAAPRVLAVDLPSGINGTTGAVMGVAVRAARNGDVLPPQDRPCCCCRAGFIAGPSASPTSASGADVLAQIKPRCWVNDPQLWGGSFPVPRTDGHKYARGHAVVVSGGLSSTGAARLAARGALRAGAGLVTIASPRDALRSMRREHSP